MSKKNKAARAFFYQHPDATPKDAWDAAWANNQSTFHAKSIQKLEAQVSALREALWTCVEHNALHFGEDHSTVIEGRAALAKARGES